MATKKTTKKATVKKATVKKTTKKATVKKTTKKASAKKATVKKSSGKKASAKKSSKKPAPRRPAQRIATSPGKQNAPEPMVKHEPMPHSSAMMSPTPEKGIPFVAIFAVIIAAVVALSFYFRKDITKCYDSHKTKIAATTADTITPEKAPKIAVETPPTEPEGVYHTVQPKDQLTTISKKYFGSTDRWKEIYEANKDRFPNLKKTIHPGQKLLIPGAKK